MLKVKVQLSLANAKQYFKQHLKIGDYYSEHHKVCGQWYGKGTKVLGLSNSVKESEFINLLEGLHPITSAKLIQRFNTVRFENGTEKANRRLYYDFCFAPPKSVSIVGLLTDPKVIELHNQCITQALDVLEAYTSTRVRKNRQNTNRPTQNFVCARFQHDTSRALDPLIHTHCIVLNVTKDPIEGKWKAVENCNMLKAQKLVHAVYNNTLSHGLEQLGYAVGYEGNSFEIQGISRQLIDRFSKRHEAILKQSEEAQPLNPNVSPEKLRDWIAHDKRARKIQNQTPEGLHQRWNAELYPEQQEILNNLKSPIHQAKPKAHPLEALFESAEEHIFERKATTTKEVLFTEVLDRCRGLLTPISTLESLYQQRSGAYRKSPSSTSGAITLKSVWQAEAYVVEKVKSGKDQHFPFWADYDASEKNLNPEQAKAVEGILKSKDFAVFLKGSAGTGKSFTLKALTEAMQAVAWKVHIFAPQRQQVLDLSKDGLEAQTVSQLLLQKEPPRNSVWIIDEAGQIGGKQMQALLTLAHENNNRILFSGDTKQHGAITASDALIALEKHSGIQTYTLDTIRRQDPDRAQSLAKKAQIRQYKQAVQAAAKGQSAHSLETIDRLGWVHQLPKAEALQTLATTYLDQASQGKSCLVVSQTHEAVQALNTSIKSHLQAAEQLGQEHTVQTFTPKDTTLSQRKDSNTYQAVDYLHFHRKYGSFEKGSILKVIDKSDTHLFLDDQGERRRINLNAAKYFSLCSPHTRSIAEGERLQLKFNGISMDNKKINNGELVTFLGLTSEGHLKVQDDFGFEKALPFNQALLNSGYAVTSYASQGKTVDCVLVYDSQNPSAIHQKEWYVSLSRGREQVLVFTPDKQLFLKQISRLPTEDLAIELSQDLQAPELERRLESQEKAVTHTQKTDQEASLNEPQIEMEAADTLDYGLQPENYEQQQTYEHHDEHEY